MTEREGLSEENRKLVEQVLAGATWTRAINDTNPLAAYNLNRLLNAARSNAAPPDDQFAKPSRCDNPADPGPSKEPMPLTGESTVGMGSNPAQAQDDRTIGPVRHQPQSAQVGPVASADTLLPCPFCGGEQIATAPSGTSTDWAVICKSCGVYVDRHDEAEALTAWNRRPAPPPEGASPNTRSTDDAAGLARGRTDVRIDGGHHGGMDGVLRSDEPTITPAVSGPSDDLVAEALAWLPGANIGPIGASYIQRLADRLQALEREREKGSPPSAARPSRAVSDDLDAGSEP